MDDVVDINKYRRGDISKDKGKPQKNPEKIILRGNAAEVLVGTDGWKYLFDWMEYQVKEYTKVLVNVQQNDINRINDIRMYIVAFNGIMNKPQEWINEKNKINKGRKK
jgi:hypothetical protein